VLRAAQVAESEARALGYQPLVAEILQLEGAVSSRANDVKAAEKQLVEAFWAADASRHDEVRAAAATELVFVSGYQEGEFDAAERWSGTAEAVLQRVGGHELLRAWQLNNIAAVRGLRATGRALLPPAGARAQGEALGPTTRTSACREEHRQRAGRAVAQSGGAGACRSRGRADRERPGANTVLARVQQPGRDPARSAPARGAASFEKARVIWERELGLEDPQPAYALTGIGVTYLAEGDPARWRRSSARTDSRGARGRPVSARRPGSRWRDRCGRPTAIACARALAEQGGRATRRRGREGG
jgi:hypothetical protein